MAVDEGKPDRLCTLEEYLAKVRHINIPHRNHAYLSAHQIECKDDSAILFTYEGYASHSSKHGRASSKNKCLQWIYGGPVDESVLRLFK